ncbi:MAG: BT4734/BF3469 family protein [Paracoccus sp. (in: a-proteobacteria)]
MPKKTASTWPRMAYFRGAESRKSAGEITLPELIANTQQGEYKAAVEVVRQLVADGANKADISAAKKQLHAVTLSGYAERRFEKHSLIEHTGYLQGDFDGKAHPDWSLDQLRTQVEASPFVIAGFVSPSGTGIKAVIKIPADIARHKDSFRGAQEHFAARGLTLDPACKDPVRLCFVSHDPEAWIIEDSAAAPTIEPVAAPKPKSRDYGPRDHADTSAEDIREMLGYIPSRPTYDEWLRIASAVWSVLGEHVGNQVLSAWSPEESEGEYQRKFKSRLKEVGVGTLVWYAMRGGFDPAAAARKNAWAGIIRFAGHEAKQGTRSAAVAPTHADGPEAKPGDEGDPFNGEAHPDNIEFLRWCLDHGQRGDAHLYASIVAGVRKYDHLAAQWWRWDQPAGVWRRDSANHVRLDLGERVIAAYLHLDSLLAADLKARPSKAENPKDDQRIQGKLAIRKRIQEFGDASWCRKVLWFAEAVPTLSVETTDFDSHRHLFGIRGGVIDFDSNEWKPSQPGHLISRAAPVSFVQSAQCPTFDAFLNLCLGDQELIDFVLRAAAYSLTGHTDEDKLFFCHGSGSNGKSTFMLILQELAGEQMTRIPSRVFMDRRGGDQTVDYQKSRMRGSRIVDTDE